MNSDSQVGNDMGTWEVIYIWGVFGHGLGWLLKANIYPSPKLDFCE